MANTENEAERVQLARARLIRAVTAGDADWMRALVERMPPDLSQYTANCEVDGNYSMPHSGEISGASLLILAVLGPDGDVLGVTAGTVSVVRDLISCGADASRELTVINPTTSGAGIADYTVQRRDADGLLKCVAWAESSITPLHLAVTAQSTKYGADLVAEILSAPGVDVNKKTTPADATTSLGGSTPLFLYPCQTPLAGALRAPAVNGRFAIVSALLRAGASLDEISGGDSAEACVQRWEEKWMPDPSDVRNHDREAMPPPVIPGFTVSGSAFEAMPDGANLASLKALLAITRRARGREFGKELVRFRSLLAKGRANATLATPRVVAWMMDPDTPREVAWKVFGFWRAQV